VVKSWAAWHASDVERATLVHERCQLRTTDSNLASHASTARRALNAADRSLDERRQHAMRELQDKRAKMRQTLNSL
jgi:hypothetical protein